MTYWSIWWRTFAWVAAVAGVVAFVVALVILIPGEIMRWIGLGALVLGFVTWFALLIWIDQKGY